MNTPIKTGVECLTKWKLLAYSSLAAAEICISIVFSGATSSCAKIIPQIQIQKHTESIMEDMEAHIRNRGR